MPNAAQSQDKNNSPKRELLLAVIACGGGKFRFRTSSPVGKFISNKYQKRDLDGPKTNEVEGVKLQFQDGQGKSLGDYKLKTITFEKVKVGKNIEFHFVSAISADGKPVKAPSINGKAKSAPPGTQSIPSLDTALIDRALDSKTTTSGKAIIRPSAVETETKASDVPNLESSAAALVCPVEITNKIEIALWQWIGAEAKKRYDNQRKRNDQLKLNGAGEVRKITAGWAGHLLAESCAQTLEQANTLAERMHVPKSVDKNKPDPDKTRLGRRIQEILLKTENTSVERETLLGELEKVVFKKVSFFEGFSVEGRVLNKIKPFCKALLTHFKPAPPVFHQTKR